MPGQLLEKIWVAGLNCLHRLTRQLHLDVIVMDLAAPRGNAPQCRRVAEHPGIEVHPTQVYSKLGVGSRTEAPQPAQGEGWGVP
jgi:DNA-binding NarL/FixJ family response regulator